MDATTQIVAVNCTQLLGLVHKLWYFAGNEVKRNLGTTILLSPTFCHSQQAMKAKRNWLQLYFHHNEIDCLNLIMTWKQRVLHHTGVLLSVIGVLPQVSVPALPLGTLLAAVDVLLLLGALHLNSDLLLSPIYFSIFGKSIFKSRNLSTTICVPSDVFS